jgi:hypothetical protein
MKVMYFAAFLLLLTSCASSPNTPESWAKKFCNCSDELGKAIVKLKAEKMTQKEFEAVKIEQEKCMGPTDPRQSMSEAEVLVFDAAFMKAIFEKCPNVARNYGFKE